MTSRVVRIIPGFALAVLVAAAASAAPALAAKSGGAQLWAAAGSRGVAESVAVSPDGSRVFVTGGSGTVAYAASTGAVLWGVSFAGSLRAVAVSPDGSRVFVTGKTTGPDGLPDYAAVAYDAATGKQLWAASYNSGVVGGDVAFAVGVSPDSASVYVTGSSDASGSVSDYATVAYAAATGKQLWAARYAGPGLGTSLATALAVSGDGTRLFVTGTSCASACSTDPVYDYATVAYAAATGSQRWAARYLAGSGAPADALAVSPDGTRVFVTGPAPSSSDPSTDYATVGYDAATGNQLWVTRFDDGNADTATSADVSPDGTRVFVTGYSHSATGTAYATVGYDATTGSQLWVARYTSATTSASSLAVTPDGTMVIMAGTSAAGSGATVGYDATTGNQLWSALYNGPCKRGTQANALATSPDSTRAFVTGSTLTGSCSYRPISAYATVAYSTR
jgi:Tol biopolymer transport system component